MNDASCHVDISYSIILLLLAIPGSLFRPLSPLPYSLTCPVSCTHQPFPLPGGLTATITSLLWPSGPECLHEADHYSWAPLVDTRPSQELGPASVVLLTVRHHMARWTEGKQSKAPSTPGTTETDIKHPSTCKLPHRWPVRDGIWLALQLPWSSIAPPDTNHTSAAPPLGSRRQNIAE